MLTEESSKSIFSTGPKCHDCPSFVQISDILSYFSSWQYLCLKAQKNQNYDRGQRSGRDGC